MPYTQTTRAQLRTEIRNRLGPTAFWRDDELNRLINEALHVWGLLTGFWRVRDTIPTTADTVFYSVPSTILSLLRIEYNGQAVSKSSLFDLDYGRINWEAERLSDGESVPVKVEGWAPVGLTLFAIWPGDDVGSNNLTFDGMKKTPLPTADGDFIDLGDEELDFIEVYVQHVATFKESGAEFEASQTSFQQFLKGAASRNAILNASAKFRKWMGIHDEEQERPIRGRESIGAR